jgi:two-component system, OmpR family, response regulator
MTSPVEPHRVAGPVWLDEDGLLHAGAEWVALSDTEWRLVALMLDHRDHLVTRHELAEAAWPGRIVQDTTLNVTMKRVRRRLAPLGLTVTTVRGRGFVLSASHAA